MKLNQFLCSCKIFCHNKQHFGSVQELVDMVYMTWKVIPYDNADDNIRPDLFYQTLGFILVRGSITFLKQNFPYIRDQVLHSFYAFSLACNSDMFS